jgi:pentafunctional AROM polypeptide
VTDELFVCDHLFDCSVVIVGMRGAGKSTLGQAAARHLGFKFVDLDVVLEERCQGGIKELVAKEGWDAFRDLETQVLAEALHEYPHETVLACGGGVVERDANVQLLMATASVVVWLDRDIEDIVAYLTADGTRPAYGESITDVYQRRESKYATVAKHRFPVYPGRADWSALTAQFVRFCGLVTGQECLPLLDSTYFVCLTVPDLTTEPKMAARLADMATEVNAVELRVDLLQSFSPGFIVRQVAFIRSACQLPIIFTVRSTAQGGKFAGSEPEYFQLLALGARLGCELLDVEGCWSEAGAQRFARSVKSQVIGCLHFQRPCSGPEDLAAVAKQCSLGGQADVIKAVFTANDPSDNFVLHSARQHLASDLVVPTIFMNMGPFGRLSRVLNTCLTPVTHELLVNAAAPGQLTAMQIKGQRRALGLVAKQDFYLFGSPVALSASPFMHNTGFARRALPHKYHRMETEDLATVLSTLSQPTTGGASLTMPFKEQLLGRLHWISPEARTIGAVNTVVKDGVGRLCGFNTDWQGIVEVLTPFLDVKADTTRALVLGAGGTARAAIFALQQLGVKDITVWNRTPDKATALAAKFGIRAEAELATACERALDVVVCTVSASAQLSLPTQAYTNK